jgi:hypothetical protein
MMAWKWPNVSAIALLVTMTAMVSRQQLHFPFRENQRMILTKTQLAIAYETYRSHTFATNETRSLLIDWEPPNNVSVICFEWTQNSDEWWTHHPTYQVQSENDTHFCFGPRTPNQAKFFQSLYKIQFQGDCSYVVTKKMWSDGWGADMRNVLDGLIHARKTNIPFQIDQTPWHYAAKQDVSQPVCPTMGLGCYFLSLSNCSPKPKTVSERTDYFHGIPAYFASRYYYDYLTRPQQ